MKKNKNNENIPPIKGGVTKFIKIQTEGMVTKLSET